MKEIKTSDRVWSVILLVIPCVALLLCMIPGMLRMWDEERKAFVNCTIFNGPETSFMSLLMPLFLIIFGVTIAIAVAYSRGQSLTTIRGLLVAAWVTCAFTFMVSFLETTLETWPFLTVPILMLVEAILVTVRSKLEEKYFDF